MLKSKSKMIKPISLPEYKGDQVYMHEFDMANPSLPVGCERWNSVLKDIISNSPKQTGKAYITIDEKIVRSGESHRPHTDGNYLFGWGGSGDGGGGWLTGEDGRFLPREQHEEQYCSEKGGMLIVSSYKACKGWNGEFEGQPNQGGDCTHLDLSKMECYEMESNTLYWGNSTFIHESLPVQEDVKRQLIRITLPADAEELV